MLGKVKGTVGVWKPTAPSVFAVRRAGVGREKSSSAVLRVRQNAAKGVC